MHGQQPNASSGQSFTEYSLLLGLVVISVIAVLVLAGPSVGNIYSDVVASFNEPAAAEGENPGAIQVVVQDDAGAGIPGVPVFAFNEDGTFLDEQGETDEQGMVSFEEFGDGRYQFRADLQGQKFFSDQLTWPQQWQAEIAIRRQPLTVRVVDAAGNGLSAVYVSAHNEAGDFVEVDGHTGEEGEIRFDLVDGIFQFRADYRTVAYWSDPADSSADSEAVIETGEQGFVARVVDAAGAGIAGVTVEARSSSGGYTGISSKTDAGGEAAFDIPEGEFKFVARYMAHNYSSPVMRLPRDRETTIETGQRPFTVHVVDAAGAPLADVRVHTFSEKENYLQPQGYTDADGALVLQIPDGHFKFRANYRSHEYWSEVVGTPSARSTTINTGEASFTLYVVDSRGAGIADVQVNAFSGSGSYAGSMGKSNADGAIRMELPAGEFVFRAYHRAQSYETGLLTVPGAGSARLTIPDAAITVHVINSAGAGISGVSITVFNEAGNYAGVGGTTNSDGKLLLTLPAGSYTFRANYLQQEIWSGVTAVPDQETVTINVKEQGVTITILDEKGNPVAGSEVAAFSSKGGYSGQKGITDKAGQVNLELPAGSFRFRVKPGRGLHWSDDFQLPAAEIIIHLR